MYKTLDITETVCNALGVVPQKNDLPARYATTETVLLGSKEINAALAEIRMLNLKSIEQVIMAEVYEPPYYEAVYRFKVRGIFK